MSVLLGSMYSLPSIESEELDLLHPHFLCLTQLLSIRYSLFHEMGSSLGFWDTILSWFFSCLLAAPLQSFLLVPPCFSNLSHSRVSPSTSSLSPLTSQIVSHSPMALTTSGMLITPKCTHPANSPLHARLICPAAYHTSVCLFSKISNLRCANRILISSQTCPTLPFPLLRKWQFPPSRVRSHALQSAVGLLSFSPPTFSHLQMQPALFSDCNQRLAASQATIPHPNQATSPLSGALAFDLANLYSLVFHPTARGTLLQCKSSHCIPLQETLTGCHRTESKFFPWLSKPHQTCPTASSDLTSCHLSLFLLLQPHFPSSRPLPLLFPFDCNICL